jgi:hypothetical protein
LLPYVYYSHKSLLNIANAFINICYAGYTSHSPTPPSTLRLTLWLSGGTTAHAPDGLTTAGHSGPISFTVADAIPVVKKGTYVITTIVLCVALLLLTLIIGGLIAWIRRLKLHIALDQHNIIYIGDEMIDMTL